jgi:hypothetical protein
MILGALLEFLGDAIPSLTVAEQDRPPLKDRFRSHLPWVVGLLAVILISIGIAAVLWFL